MSGLFLALALAVLTPDLASAERAYLEGRFAEARSFFEKALALKDAAEGELLFNIGNCAYREGKFAEAVLHYRRARLRMPRDPELRFNLGMAERELVLDPKQARSFAETVGSLLGLLTPGELLLLVAVLQTAGLLGLVLLQPGAPRKLMVVLVVLGVLGAARLARLSLWPGLPAGIVLGREIALREGPRAELPSSSSLTLGETVRILQTSGSWVLIDHPEASGWTELSGVGLVD